MPNFEKMYFLLFNRITDAIGELEKNNYGNAIDILKSSQLAAEDFYISDTFADEAENR